MSLHPNPSPAPGEQREGAAACRFETKPIVSPQLESSQHALPAEGVLTGDDHRVFGVIIEPREGGGVVLLVQCKTDADSDVPYEYRLLGGSVAPHQDPAERLQQYALSQLGIHADVVFPYGPILAPNKDAEAGTTQGYFIVPNSATPPRATGASDGQGYGWYSAEGLDELTLKGRILEMASKSDFEGSGPAGQILLAALKEADTLMALLPREASAGDETEEGVDESTEVRESTGWIDALFSGRFWGGNAE